MRLQTKTIFLLPGSSADDFYNFAIATVSNFGLQMPLGPLYFSTSQICLKWHLYITNHCL